MSRYKFCIVTEGLDWLGERVCHDTIYCIMIRESFWACIRLGVPRYSRVYLDKGAADMVGHSVAT